MKPPILELVTTLEWYEERIMSLCRRDVSDTYIEAVMMELMLDGGKRARNAIDNVKDLE